MALNTPLLKQHIKAAFKAQTTKENNPDTALDDLAGKLAQAMQTYITSATVTVPPGVAVATAGTAAAQTGATTAPGIGTIS